MTFCHIDICTSQFQEAFYLQILLLQCFHNKYIPHLAHQKVDMLKTKSEKSSSVLSLIDK